MTGRSESAAPPARRRAWLALAAMVGMTGLLGVMNVIVDPIGVFRSALFDPVVLPARRAKFERLGRYPTVPDTVVLGSSRAFSMSPATLTRRGGGTAFNASVEGGSPIDDVAFLRFMLARWGRLPRTLILALSPEELIPGDEMIQQDPGNPLLPYWGRVPSARARWHRRGLAVDPDTTVMSVVALVDAWRDRRPVRWFRFDPDGGAQFPPIFDEPSTRADLFRKALSMRRGWFETPRPVSALQREALAEVLTLSRAHAVRVLAYLPPNHPYLLTYWRSAPWFDRAAAATVRFLWATPGVNLTVCDFRDPTSLGRPAGDELYDVVHPTKALNDEIVARLETGRCRRERSTSGGRP